MQHAKMTNAVLTTIAGLTVITVALILFSPRQAMATPDIAKKTGQSCSQCHTAPPALNAYGKKYQDSQKK